MRHENGISYGNPGSFHRGRRFWCRQGQFNAEPGTASLLTFDPNPATMGLDDGLNNGEAQAGAAGATGSRLLGPEKPIENMR